MTRPKAHADIDAARRRMFAGLLMVDVGLTLFPPLYWAAGGSAMWSLTYFIGGGFLVMLSLLLMNHLEKTADQASSEQVVG